MSAGKTFMARWTSTGITDEELESEIDELMSSECKSDQASQREAFKKNRIRRNTNNVKKDISSYLKWCKISGLKAEDERSLNLYIELTTLIMEQMDDSL